MDPAHKVGTDSYTGSHVCVCERQRVTFNAPECSASTPIKSCAAANCASPSILKCDTYTHRIVSRVCGIATVT